MKYSKTVVDLLTIERGNQTQTKVQKSALTILASESPSEEKVALLDEMLFTSQNHWGTYLNVIPAVMVAVPGCLRWLEFVSDRACCEFREDKVPSSVPVITVLEGSGLLDECGECLSLEFEQALSNFLSRQIISVEPWVGQPGEEDKKLHGRLSNAVATYVRKAVDSKVRRRCLANLFADASSPVDAVSRRNPSLEKAFVFSNAHVTPFGAQLVREFEHKALVLLDIGASAKAFAVMLQDSTA